MSKSRNTLLFLLAALAGPAAAQSFDNTGNHLLSGTYYFREVTYDLNANTFAVVYGNIAFTGSGTYTTSATEGDTGSMQLVPFNVSGTYSISASGYGFISNSLLNSPIYGLVSNGIFIGSSTESGRNDLFIAAPVASQNAGTLNGSYSIAYMHPLIPAGAFIQMNANGGGGISNFNLAIYQTSSTPTNQSISGVKYTSSNAAFVMSFPNSNTNLLTGQQFLYSSADGSFIFGGSPQDFDFFVGVRNGSSGSNFSGLFYQAGLDEDASQLVSANTVGLDTYYGSMNVDSTDSIIVGHQRQFSVGVGTFGFTYGDFSQLSSNATYSDSFFGENYIGGNGGTVRIGYGIGPLLGLSVAFQAPSFNGTGAFINPAGVLNAASFAPFTAGVSPGELITIVGSNIGPGSLQVAQSVPFPTKLGNVQVMVNGIAAPIYYVSANQVSAIIPYEVASSSVAQIQIVNGSSSSNVVTEFINQTTPGIFTEPAGGAGDAAALHPDFSLVTKNSPAQIGETVAVFVTGLGSTFPLVPDGAAGPSPNLANTSATMTATVDAIPATVTFAGLAPGLAGLYQVNVTIPSGVTPGDVYLELIGPDSDALEAGIQVGSGVNDVKGHAKTNAAHSQRKAGQSYLPVRPRLLTPSAEMHP
jgi:uncharacterized protein (TIGR03437 family)